MTINEVRAVLGTDYDCVTDETLIAFIDLVEAISSYVVAIESSQNNSENIQIENHEP